MLVLVFVYGPWQLALFLFGAMPAMFGVMGVMVNMIAGDELKAQRGGEVKSEHHLAERSAGKLLSEVVQHLSRTPCAHRHPCPHAHTRTHAHLHRHPWPGRALYPHGGGLQRRGALFR